MMLGSFFVIALTMDPLRHDLFADGNEASGSALPIQKAKPVGRARVQQPNRKQLELRPSDLESLLPEGHLARIVWGYVERQDLTGLYAGIKAVEGGVGRSAIAPEILFALWLYATLEGIGSARAITRLTQEHDLPLDLWRSPGQLSHRRRLSQPARRRAGRSADRQPGQPDGDWCGQTQGWGSRRRARACQRRSRLVRREEKLESLLASARERVAALKKQVDDDPGAESRRKAAAQARAALAREARIEAALARLPELADIKKRQGKKPEEARASTTDAEATVMKMGDGGFRPAYNIEFCSDTESQVIVGVDVVTTGSDMGQMPPW